MIDLHCHLLPGVDDGAQDVDESLRLARCAVSDGITDAVLTPHIHPVRYPNTKSKLLHTFVRYQDMLRKNDVPLRLHLAAEVRLSMESLELIAQDEVPFLGMVGGYRIMLLEFPHDAIPIGAEQFVARLLQMKIKPLIAHPERNKCVMSLPARIRPFVEMGCWLQLTASSLTGHFGRQAKAIAIQLLEHDMVWVLATDAHNLEHRPPKLSDGTKVAAEIVGTALASRMVRERPSQILGLQTMESCRVDHVALAE